MQPTLSTQNANKVHWKDTALEKAEVLTDTWEVAKAYAGRAAEWVLFLCMVVNIIEMLPGITMASWVINLVLSVQVVMLDIGGMSLSTMAAHAREKGATANARKADITSKFLIGLMIVTLLLVTIGILFPAMKPYADMAEKGLILVRVVMTVIYGHVIHSLRSSNSQAVSVPAMPIPQPAVPSNAELETLIRDTLVPVLAQYRTETKLDIAEQIKQALSEIARHPQEKLHKDDSGDLSKEAGPQQPTPLPIASMRKDSRLLANREGRLAAAYHELMQEGVRPTGDALSRRARCNRAAALNWLKTKQIAV